MEETKIYLVHITVSTSIKVKATSFYPDAHGVNFTSKISEGNSPTVAFFPYDKIVGVIEEKSFVPSSSK